MGRDSSQAEEKKSKKRKKGVEGDEERGNLGKKRGGGEEEKKRKGEKVANGMEGEEKGKDGHAKGLGQKNVNETNGEETNTKRKKKVKGEGVPSPLDGGITEGAVASVGKKTVKEKKRTGEEKGKDKKRKRKGGEREGEGAGEDKGEGKVVEEEEQEEGEGGKTVREKSTKGEEKKKEKKKKKRKIEQEVERKELVSGEAGETKGEGERSGGKGGKGLEKTNVKGKGKGEGKEKEKKEREVEAERESKKVSSGEREETNGEGQGKGEKTNTKGMEEEKKKKKKAKKLVGDGGNGLLSGMSEETKVDPHKEGAGKDEEKPGKEKVKGKGKGKEGREGKQEKVEKEGAEGEDGGGGKRGKGKQVSEEGTLASSDEMKEKKTKKEKDKRKREGDAVADNDVEQVNGDVGKGKGKRKKEVDEGEGRKASKKETKGGSKDEGGDQEVTRKMVNGTKKGKQDKKSGKVNGTSSEKVGMGSIASETKTGKTERRDKDAHVHGGGNSTANKTKMGKTEQQGKDAHVDGGVSSNAEKTKLDKTERQGKDAHVHGGVNSVSSEAGAKREKKTTGSKKRVFNVEDLPTNVLTGERLTSWSEKKDTKDVKWGPFSAEEDAILAAAVYEFIKARGWDLEEGLQKVLNCRQHPEARGVFLEIAPCLPTRALRSIRFRTRKLFDEGYYGGRWSEEEVATLRRLHAEHGPKWSKLSKLMGRADEAIKFKWRDLGGGQELVTGKWSHEEMERLCTLVQQQLRAKAANPITHDLGGRQVRDDMDWVQISKEMKRRSVACITQWYYKLAPSMVMSGEWGNRDDRRLLEALMDAGVDEEHEVDWDHLLDNRSAAVCRKRWQQIKRHLPQGYFTMEERIEMAMRRFAPDLLDPEASSQQPMRALPLPQASSKESAKRTEMEDRAGKEGEGSLREGSNGAKDNKREKGGEGNGVGEMASEGRRNGKEGGGEEEAQGGASKGQKPEGLKGERRPKKGLAEKTRKTDRGNGVVKGTEKEKVGVEDVSGKVGEEEGAGKTGEEKAIKMTKKKKKKRKQK